MYSILAEAGGSAKAETHTRTLRSQNFLAECRERQLDRQVGGAVVLVDHGIHFDNFEAEHAAVVGDDFHGEVRLAVGGAAAYGSAHSGGVLGIDPVHVEGNVVAGRAASGHAEGFFHDCAHAALVNVAHGEDADAGAT